MSWYTLIHYAARAVDDLWFYMELVRDRHAEKEKRRRENALRGRNHLLRRMWTAQRATLQQEHRSAGLRWRRMPGAASHATESFTRKRKQVISKQKKQVQRSIRCRSNTTL